MKCQYSELNKFNKMNQITYKQFFISKILKFKKTNHFLICSKILCKPIISREIIGLHNIIKIVKKRY